MDLERCWADRTGPVLDAIGAREHREAQIFIIAGGPGHGCSDVLRALARQAGRRNTVWVDAVTGERLGAHAIVSVQDQPDGTGWAPRSATPIAAALRTVGENTADSGLLVLVDGFHLLGKGDAATVVGWLQERRFTDTVVVIGVHPAQSRPGRTQDLSLLTGAQTIDLPRLEGQALTAFLVDTSPDLPPESLGEVAEFSLGVPALAREAAEHLATVPDPRVVQASLKAAINRVGLTAVGHLPPDDVKLSLASVLAAPEGSVNDVAAVLDIDRAEAPRVAVLLDEVGLLGGDDERHALVRSAVLSSADPQQVREAAAVALGLLERVGARPHRILEMLELLGAEDGNYLNVARQAFEAALEHGHQDRALELALQALRRSRCPDVIAWARGAVFGLALSRDWARAQSMIQSGGHQDTLVREMIAGEELPAEFSLDASHAVGQVTEAILAASLDPDGKSPNDCSGLPPGGEMVLHRHLLAGRPVSPRLLTNYRASQDGAVRPLELSCLLVAALRGRPAEDWLSQVEERLTESVGMFNVGAHSAALVGAAHLALANHQAAQQWSSVATITAGPTEGAARGLGHLVAAQAQLRLGHLDEAATQATAAGESFRALRARQLITFADWVVAHVEVEAGRGCPAPVHPGERSHPVLDTYAMYVGARHDLAEGRVEAGVQGLFSVGRRLESLGLANPTLVNWRPHLVAMFRAGHEDGYARMVEEDLIRSMRRWHRTNPLSARRRSHILGRHAHEVGPWDPSGRTKVDPPSTPGERAELSAAETRVVRLVVQGRSNRETARELYLSKRTVDTHLSNIYRKLGLRSRGELEAYLRERPLQDLTAHPAAPPEGAVPPVYG